MQQVSASLDKTGVFCRQALDCALVAQTLSSPADAANISAAGKFPQETAQPAEGPWNILGRMPRISSICAGYLTGTDQQFVDKLRQLGMCVKGPLTAPPESDIVEDILTVILASEVAVSFEGLWLKGLIGVDNHWYPMVQLGQVTSAGGYLKAQRALSILHQDIARYFADNGINVLLKPARTQVGVDGFATLLGLPEVLIPVGFTPQTSSADTYATSATTSGAATATGSNDGSGPSKLQPPGSSTREWLQPIENSIIALRRDDATAIAVADAFQSVTDHHLRRPPELTNSSQAAAQHAVQG